MQKKILPYYAHAAIILILLTVTVQAASLTMGDSAGNLTFNSDRARLSILSSYVDLQDELHDSPIADSVSHDGSNPNDQIASGKFVPAAEPGMLFILGLGLMGLALYRRFKIK